MVQAVTSAPANSTGAPSPKATPSSDSKSRQQYVCPLCGDGFKRQEHMSRHLLCHSDERPHACSECGKSFSRRDALNRHKLAHAAAVSSSRSSVTRINRACQSCAKSRLRCDGQTPCSRCAGKQIECTYPGRPRRRIAPLSDQLVQKVQAQVASKANYDALEQHGGQQIQEPPQGQQGQPLPTELQDAPQDRPRDLSSSGYFLSANSNVDTTLPDQGNVNGQPQVVEASQFQAVDPMTYPPMQMDNPALSLWDQPFQFTDYIDWTELGSLFTDWPVTTTSPNGFMHMSGTESEKSFGMHNQVMSTYTPTAYHSTPQPPPMGTRGEHDGQRATNGHVEEEDVSHENMSKLVTGWVPKKEDNILAFPEMTSVPADILKAETFLQVTEVSQNSYDEWRRMAIQLSTGPNTFRPFKTVSFPPIEVINCFVQLYFEHFHPIFPMLHQPTFVTSQLTYQLGLVIAGIGAQYSTLPGARSCATCLHELCRRAVLETIERDSRSTRELEFAQFLILNNLGMAYSGDKRLSEFAQVLRTGPIVASRQTGGFQPPLKSIVIDTSTHGAELDRQWKEWLSDELKRRSAIGAWMLDCQALLYLNLSSIVSLSEIQQILPCHESVWEADSAESWKEAYLALPRPPSMSAAIMGLAGGTFNPSTLGDFARLCLVFSIHRGSTDVKSLSDSKISFSVNAVLEQYLHDWSTKACDALDKLKSWDHNWSDQQNPLRMRLELHLSFVSMLLLIPAQAMLDYAQFLHSSQDRNKYTFQLASNRLKAWVQEGGGDRARRAVYLAGSSFGLLRDEGKSRHGFRGYYEPVMTVMACLVLWCYGLLQDDGSSIGSADAAHLLHIDRVRSLPAEGLKAQSWLELGPASSLRPYIHEIGDICQGETGKHLLSAGVAMLVRMRRWGLGRGLAGWLNALKNRSKGPRENTSDELRTSVKRKLPPSGENTSESTPIGGSSPGLLRHKNAASSNHLNNLLRPQSDYHSSTNTTSSTPHAVSPSQSSTPYSYPQQKHDLPSLSNTTISSPQSYLPQGQSGYAPLPQMMAPHSNSLSDLASASSNAPYARTPATTLPPVSAGLMNHTQLPSIQSHAYARQGGLDILYHEAMGLNRNQDERERRHQHHYQHQQASESYSFPYRQG